MVFGRGALVVTVIGLFSNCSDDIISHDGGADAVADVGEIGEGDEATAGAVDGPDDVDAGADDAPGVDVRPQDDSTSDAVSDVGPSDVTQTEVEPDADANRDADGGTRVIDGPPDPDAPRICYGPDEPNERWVGYYMPFCQTGLPWPDTIIPTCWSKETSRRPEFATYSRTIESFVRDNFNRPTRIDFLGWQVCETIPDPTAPAVAPPASQLVLSLTDDTDWSGNLGFGAGGERHLSIGVKGPFLTSQIVEAFVHILGLSYRVGVRQPSPGALLSNETAGLQVFFGRRPGGTIVGREARCLEAKHTAPGTGPDAAAPAPELGSTVQLNECLSNEWQDLQWNQEGALSLTSSPDVFLQADRDGQTVRLTTRKPELTEQIWAVKGASLRTDGLKCIGVPNGNFFEGQVVILATCDGSAAQEWEVDFELGKLRHGALCLGVSDGVVQAGNPLQIQKCRSTDTQTFTFRSNNEIQFKDMCLNVLRDTNEDGSPLALWPCVAPVAGNEVFYLHGRIQNGSSCLEMPSEPGIRSLALKPCAGAESQQWDIHMRTILKL
jgi:hypothetical protein